MNVRELIEWLETCNPDAVVKVAMQPSYPKEADIYKVWEDEPDYYENEREEADDTYGEIVYLGTRNEDYYAGNRAEYGR